MYFWVINTSLRYCRVEKRCGNRCPTGKCLGFSVGLSKKILHYQKSNTSSDLTRRGSRPNWTGRLARFRMKQTKQSSLAQFLLLVWAFKSPRTCLMQYVLSFNLILLARLCFSGGNSYMISSPCNTRRIIIRSATGARSISPSRAKIRSCKKVEMHF